MDFDTLSALRQRPPNFNMTRDVGHAITNDRSGKRLPGPPIPDLHAEEQRCSFALPCSLFLRFCGIDRSLRASGARRGCSFRSLQQCIGCGDIPGFGNRSSGSPLRCFLGS